MLDILIINYNAIESLKALLDALTKTQASPTLRAKLHITVVDNASSDGSANLVKTQYPSVNLIAREENDGYSVAVNEGIASTHHREILVLNSDVVITPEKIASLRRIWERMDYPGIIAPLHLEEDGFPQLTWGAYPNPANEAKRKRLEAGLTNREEWARRDAMREASRTREVEWVSGSCMLFTRAMAQQIGPWDSNFFLYFEDIDWCLRVREAGLRVVHTAEVTITHEHGASMEQEPDVAEIEYRSSQCYFIYKYFGRWTFWQLRLYLTSKMLGRFIIGGWSGFDRGVSWDILRVVWSNPGA